MVGNGEKIGHHAIVLLQHQQQSLWFCSDINKMALVFIQHQQHCFCFITSPTMLLLICSNIISMAVKTENSW